MGRVRAVIELPEALYRTLSAHGYSKERIAAESRKLLALKCFRDNVLSLGKAAELAGLSRWDFIEYLSENGVPVVDHKDELLTQEAQAAKKIARRARR